LSHAFVMLSPKGKFIVVDGIDGSGKSSLLFHIADYLLEKGLDKNRLLLTAEPTDGLFGHEIRELLKAETDPKANARKFLDLYVRDRREHVKKELLPALVAGKIVVCDRYKYATLAYQSAQGIPVQEIVDLHKGLPVPGLALILDVPASIALERMQADKRRAYLEKFERVDFQEEIRGVFQRMPGFFPGENIQVLDACRPLREIMPDVKKLLDAFLP